MGGGIGDNLFIIISGYYMINSSFSLKKVMKLVLQVTFYSFSLTVLYFLLEGEGIPFITVIQSLVPFLSGKWYWFVVIYLEVYFASPIINYGIKGISKNHFRFLLFVFGFVFVVVPDIIHQFISVNEFGYSQLIWMIYIYCVGAYLRLYPITGRYKESALAFLFTFLVIMITSKIALLCGLFTSTDMIGNIAQSLLSILSGKGLNSLLPFIITVLTLYVFLNNKIGYKRSINTIAQCVFGIYLIHDHTLLRNIIWTRLFRIPDIQNDLLFPVYCCLIVAVIFVGCIIIEKARMIIIEKPVMDIRFVKNIDNQFDRWLNA